MARRKKRHPENQRRQQRKRTRERNGAGAALTAKHRVRVSIAAAAGSSRRRRSRRHRTTVRCSPTLSAIFEHDKNETDIKSLSLPFPPSSSSSSSPSSPPPLRQAPDIRTNERRPHKSELPNERLLPAARSLYSTANAHPLPAKRNTEQPFQNTHRQTTTHAVLKLKLNDACMQDITKKKHSLTRTQLLALRRAALRSLSTCRRRCSRRRRRRSKRSSCRLSSIIIVVCFVFLACILHAGPLPCTSRGRPFRGRRRARTRRRTPAKTDATARRRRRRRGRRAGAGPEEQNEGEQGIIKGCASKLSRSVITRGQMMGKNQRSCRQICLYQTFARRNTVENRAHELSPTRIPTTSRRRCSSASLPCPSRARPPSASSPHPRRRRAEQTPRRSRARSRLHRRVRPACRACRLTQRNATTQHINSGQPCDMQTILLRFPSTIVTTTSALPE